MKRINGITKMFIRNIIIGLIAAAPLLVIPSTGQAQVSTCWPDGWESMEIEAKWETADPSVPICNDSVRNPNATYNKIIAAFPNGGTYSTKANTYTLSVRTDGISRKFVDIYYDNANNELSNSLHVLRHRTRYTTSPLASNNCPETLEQATLRKDEERVQYKSTPFLFTPIWFREETGNECNVWERTDEKLCDARSVPDIIAGRPPTHPAIQRLLVDHPGFDFSTNEPFLEVTQWRYRVEFLDKNGESIYEMSLDQVTTKQLPVGITTFSVEVEVEVIKENKDVNDVMELFTIAAQLQDKFNLIPSTKSKGEIEAIGRISVPSGDVDALIAAINTANSMGKSTIINLEGGTYTLKKVDNNTDGANGLPSITCYKTITHSDGINPIIERDVSANIPPFRIFHIGKDASVELDGITVRNGSTISDGGGVFNHGNLVIKNSTISDNTAVFGGGIANLGSLTLNNCTIGSNTATTSDTTDGGGGIRNNEGAALSLNNCIVSGNKAESGDGGGILNRGELNISGSSIVNNFCGDDGAGMSTRSFFVDVKVSNSALNNNIAKEDAGGMDVESGVVTLVNCTVGSNTANIDGGGINNEGDLTLVNCTIAKNIASDDGGGIKNNVGDVTLQNTIIANNKAADDGKDYDGRDGIGNISLGNNIISNRFDANISFLPSDKPDNDPLLGSFLVDEGKPGHGHYPLKEGSPAIDAGTRNVFETFPDTRFDQLGTFRPQDGNRDGAGVPDIGAIEAFPVVNDLVREAENKRTTSYSPLPVPNGPAGTFKITATFTSNAIIGFPHFEVVELSSKNDSGNFMNGENFLLNADGGPGGVGSTLTPNVGGDKLLLPGESFVVVFEIGLKEKEPFRFLVNLLGEANE